MALPQELIDAIENLVEEKFNDLIRDHKINAEVVSADLTSFEEEQMLEFDGNENINQGFFRKFLRWLSNYLNTLMTSIEEMTFDSVRYITPVDYAVPPVAGKIIAPFAHLVVTGAGVKPTIPDPAGTTPDEVGFDLSTHIMEGALAYNETDNLWYYRGGDTIYDLHDALALGIADIDQLTETIGDLEPKQAGKSLSANDLTDLLKTAYDGAVSHSEIEDIHLEPDGVTIQKSAGVTLEVIASAIKAMITGTLPLAVDVNGNITLAIDDATLEIVANKLTVKAVAVTTKLAFDEGTGVLSVDAGGDASVDLSSLSVPGGTIDLTNYVKKTGETSQTITGTLKATGEIEPFA